MPAEGIARAFVAVVATIGGSIALSAFALLALQQRAPSDAPTAPVAVTRSTAADATPVASPSVPTGEVSTPTKSPEGAATETPTVTAAPTETAALAVREEPPTPTATPTATAEPPSDELQYVVVRGDALELIARRFGIPLSVISARNNLQPPYTLEVGQVLIIPVEP